MPKQVRIASLSLWPGLAQIWSGQELLGLMLASLFAFAFNFAIVSRWIWTDAFPGAWPDFFAVLTVMTWIASLTYTLWWVGFCHPERHREEIEGLFREAHEAYLQGRWTDAKRRIERILVMDESDIDALMQLGTIYSRIDQSALARQTFRQCLELQGGSKWRWEIQQALRRLDGV
jgi:hypothetical protein